MNRRADQLVSQWLEGISRKALEKYQNIIKDFVRHRHGIYALYRRNKLYYVGLASNLRSRLHHHLEDRHGRSWDSFSVYLTINDKHLRQLESLVLRIAAPKGNRQKGGFGQAENLRRRFRQAIRAYHRHELNDLFAITRAVRDRAVETQRNGSAIKLAPYVTRGFKIRLFLHDKAYWASVRSNGMIRFHGRLYKSPSGAAFKIAKRGIDGWTEWHFERAPGDWVPLDTLRK